MPVIESTQHKLDRVRPPRVQITYDVEIGDAIEKVELPFVMGIIADLAGDLTEDEKADRRATPLSSAERKFQEIDRDNYNQIMRAISPKLLNLSVRRTLPKETGEEPGPDDKLSVNLTFKTVDDFNPASVIEQIDELRGFLEERNHLRDLQTKLDGNEPLKQLLLDEIVNQPKQ